VTFTFEPQNSITSIGYPEIIPYTKFEHSGIIRFLVMLRTNRQTDKQMDLKILPTPTDIVGVGNIAVLRRIVYMRRPELGGRTYTILRNTAIVQAASTVGLSGSLHPLALILISCS